MRLPVPGGGWSERHYYKWPLVTCPLLMMVLLLVVEFPLAYRLGLGVGNTVRGHGTAQVRMASCQLSGLHVYLLYTCDADVAWDEPDYRTRDGLGSGRFELTATRPLSGPVPVVDACRAESVCAVLPADAPFRGRWWLLPSFALPLAGALALGMWMTRRLPEPPQYRTSDP